MTSALLRRLVCSSLFLNACFTVRAITVDKKSTLEEQFIGEFEALSDDLSTIASVRASAHGLGEDGSDPYGRALQARRLQLFYAEDLAAARKRGCTGEALDGRLLERLCSSSAQPATPSIARLVATENAARAALVEFALMKNVSLGEHDREGLWRAVHHIHLSALEPGDWFEDDQQKWMQK